MNERIEVPPDRSARPSGVKLTRRGRVLVALAIVVALLGAAGLGGLLYLRSIGVGGSSDPGKKVEVEIPQGLSAEEIGAVLDEQGVIESALAFRIAVFLGEEAEDIQAGTYEIARGLTASDALHTLVEEGPVVDYINVTFPEGSWLTDFAAIVEEQAGISGDRFLELTAEGRISSRLRPRGIETMEGLLFPSTYQVIERDTARSLAERLAAEFDRRAGSLDFSQVEAMGVTPYEAIIVASMIEAEARVPEDRPRIAAVIYNRLEEGMALGIDATVLYALGEHKEELTQSDLEVDSPYNTRQVTGLPPTPIGAPGLESLRAAVAPEEADWLYYVLADCEGHHAFSVGYAEFLENKAAYQELEC